MKNIKNLILITVILAGSIFSAAAQDTTRKTTREERREIKAADVKKLINNKRFVFKAQYANPLGGGFTSLNGRMINISPDGTGHIYLNYNYDVKIRPDSVIAYLPYYGRTTFDANYGNTTDNGVMFTSTKFGYTFKAGKKGSTVITITPTDAKYNRKMILEIQESGIAQLQMIITNRNAISYDGYIEEK
ncbi:DUF4251 domain-containing protein [Mucilaginibacter galii]|uniref:DUF4251 domain-containing protein n=1 Tax=Mucilaginibacter galii TaxID=2005073 RepID=A0A917N1Z1_9SPHI|nr:DUF4251 domain-containing protein [Mucilaginibacter galii]GGI51425.1 hypothetical protein GCM10011425_26370 [Mucilaginibacter galii]